MKKTVITRKTPWSRLLTPTPRTRCPGPEDLRNLERIQAGYQAQPLSAFMKSETPPIAPAVDWPTPLTPEGRRTSRRSFDIYVQKSTFRTTLRSRIRRAGQKRDDRAIDRRP